MLRTLLIALTLFLTGCYLSDQTIIAPDDTYLLPGGPGNFQTTDQESGETKNFTVTSLSGSSRTYRVTGHGEDKEFHAQLRFLKISGERYLVQIFSKKDDGYQLMVADIDSKQAIFFSPHENEFQQIMASKAIPIVKGPPVFGDKAPAHRKIEALKSKGATFVIDQFGYSVFGERAKILSAFKKLAGIADISTGSDKLTFLRK